MPDQGATPIAVGIPIPAATRTAAAIGPRSRRPGVCRASPEAVWRAEGGRSRVHSRPSSRATIVASLASLAPSAAGPPLYTCCAACSASAMPAASSSSVPPANGPCARTCWRSALGPAALVRLPVDCAAAAAGELGATTWARRGQKAWCAQSTVFFGRRSRIGENREAPRWGVRSRQAASPLAAAAHDDLSVLLPVKCTRRTCSSGQRCLHTPTHAPVGRRVVGLFHRGRIRVAGRGRAADSGMHGSTAFRPPGGAGSVRGARRPAGAGVRAVGRRHPALRQAQAVAAGAPGRLPAV